MWTYLFYWALGGWIFGLVYSLSRKQRLQCGTCGRFYEIHTGTTKVFRIILIVLWLLILLGLLSFVFA